MASTYSTSFRFELIATGEKNGTWGTTTNTNLGTLIEQAIGGYTTVVLADANYALTATNGASDEARCMSLKITGPLTATRNVTCPDSIKKLYIVENATTGSQSIVFKTTSGTGITIPNGSKYILQVDGTNVIQATGTMAAQAASSVAITGGSITGITDLAVADGGTGSSTAAGARTNLSAAASGANTDITSIYLNNTGLKIKDTNASHGLTIAPGSDLTADRTLTITTGDAARTLDISGGSVTITAAAATVLDDATVAAMATTLGLGTSDSPQFAGVNVGNASDTTITRVSAGVLAVEGNTIVAPASPAQGDVIYHNGSAWVRLAAGTSGQVLKTNGAAANPSWGAASGSAYLGSINTTTGNTATLSSLDLTNYKMLKFYFNNLSHDSGATPRSYALNGTTFTTTVNAATGISGIVELELNDGAIWLGGLSAGALSTTPIVTTITTATTSLTITVSGGSFDGSDVRVWGFT